LNRTLQASGVAMFARVLPQAAALYTHLVRLVAGRCQTD